MEFYIRKAISVGPFRFSLSKSGVGVLAGGRGRRSQASSATPELECCHENIYAFDH